MPIEIESGIEHRAHMEEMERIKKEKKAREKRKRERIERYKKELREEKKRFAERYFHYSKQLTDKEYKKAMKDCYVPKELVDDAKKIFKETKDFKSLSKNAKKLIQKIADHIFEEEKCRAVFIESARRLEKAVEAGYKEVLREIYRDIHDRAIFEELDQSNYEANRLEEAMRTA